MQQRNAIPVRAFAKEAARRPTFKGDGSCDLIFDFLHFDSISLTPYFKSLRSFVYVFFEFSSENLSFFKVDVRELSIVLKKKKTTFLVNGI